MQIQEEIDYRRIEQAIAYIKANHKLQPSLEEIASMVHMSPFHFQRMFTTWAGVSPKQFLQYLNLEYAKSILRDQQATLFEAAMETGLSGTSRLHDLFIKIEGMTPAEYKNGGQALQIVHEFKESPFGTLILASTLRGICHIAFSDQGREAAVINLKQKFPNAAHQAGSSAFHPAAMAIFSKDWSDLPELKLHLKGTAFQLKVWEALLRVPFGDLTTYSRLATIMNHPKASRAVGTAVGDNPIAYIIPCHRVIRSTGEIGQYHWGPERKNAMIGWEAANKKTEIQQSAVSPLSKLTLSK